MALTALDAVVLACAGALLVAAGVLVLWERRRLDAAVRDLHRAVSSLAESGGPAPPLPRNLPELAELTERLVAGELAARADSAMVLARLAEALSTVPEGVVLCDEHGAIRYRNAAGEAFAGARHGDALAEHAVSELLAQARSGTPAEQQLDLYGPPRRTLLVRALPIGDGSIIGAVAIIEDISERRRLDAVRRDFVANVSHELKTPVGALGILAETMQAEDDPDVTRRLAARMHLEAFRVARIIDDLLDLSRIESEESPRHEPVPVDEMIGEAVDRIRPLAEHRRITVERSEVPPRLTVGGDRRQLVSAVHNLLENAVNYSDQGSSVEVAVSTSVDHRAGGSAWVELTVRDHGIGIPARDLERIFERFYRVDRARSRETGGTGLGLAIVHHVAANHHGEVTVDSREGEGSTFTLRLPAGPGPVAITQAEAG